MVPQLHVTDSARARCLHSHAYVSLFPPLSRVFLSLFYCLTCLFFSLILPLPYCLIQAPTPTHPPTHPPSFSRALSSQSRFASHFQKPLKASHFRILHSRAAHQLCHSPGRERTSLLADTHHSPAHTRKHTHTLFLIHTCALNLPQLIVFQNDSVCRPQISRAGMGFAEGNKQCDS